MITNNYSGRCDLYLWLPMFLLSVLAGCDKAPPSKVEKDYLASSQATLSVYTVNYPLYYFAKRLAGDKCEVFFPAPTDIDPAYWNPTPEQLMAYQQTDLILLNGAAYSKWLDKVTLPEDKIIDTTWPFRKELIVQKSEGTHSHGLKGKHTYSGVAFTTWLDLEQAAAQAETVKEGLIALLPQQKGAFEQKYEILRDQLFNMDQQLMALSKLLNAKPVIFSHPVYQYFQRRYRLNGDAVHWEPDQIPTEEQWRQLETLLTRHPAQLMIWEAQPLAAVVQQLNSMGVEVVVFQPLASRPEQGDFISAMEVNIAILRDWLSER